MHLIRLRTMNLSGYVDLKHMDAFIGSWWRASANRWWNRYNFL